MSIKLKGIDVSYAQGNINWEKVKASGIAFAILRCGYGQDIMSQDDKFFERNAKACEELNIPYGVYLYSYATSETGAIGEAKHTLRLLKGKKLSYPVFYDLEDESTGKCTNSEILKIAKAYVAELEKEGYKVGIYANKHWFTSKLTQKWYDNYPKWVAQYNNECTYKGTYDMWQYTDKGKVSGISGNVDMNYCYTEFAAETKPNAPVQEAPKKNIDELAKEVLTGGIWGNGEERKNKLKAAGYDYDTAISMLEGFTGNKSKYPEMEIRLSEYKQQKSLLIAHNDPGAIPNLSFHVLIADPSRTWNQELGGQ